MYSIKLPPSITDWEIRKILQAQGYHTIISISQDKDGQQIIQAY